MTDSVFERLRARGGEVLTQISAELAGNEHFMRAIQGAAKGKEKLEEAVGRTLKTLNVPTRSDHKKVLSRVEALEEEVASLKAKLKKASGKARSKRSKK